MIVFGKSKSDNTGFVLYTGEMHSCIRFCKGLKPQDFESINIDQDDGVILKHIISDGLPARDFKDLISLQ